MQNPEEYPVLRDWLRTRSPEVPPAFLPYLLTPGADAHEADASGEVNFTALALLALSRALAGPGKDRDGAFHLLTADALITYACESVAEGEGDIRTGLEEILDRVGGDYR
jgi:hypothetical protein